MADLVSKTATSNKCRTRLKRAGGLDREGEGRLNGLQEIVQPVSIPFIRYFDPIS
ncbi:hypothetical protein J6590_008164 [Homalodisca vitripennis]|nr:hypothetical protein J6590_008164 [Homalodisca vitripennis]